jgi:threonine dehydrogenase-like Zn-dependent dehydrogenase
MDSPALVQAGLSVLRPHGTGVFLGGVASNVPISYLTTLVKELNIKGSWMYPDRAPADIAAMIETGVLNLGAFQPQTYPLERVNDAIAAAGAARGLDYIILQP